MDYAIKISSANLVVKANKLIEARYKFTLWEMRIFTSMVSLLKPDDVEFQYCKLYIKDLMEFYNSSSKEDYETIRAVPVSLSRKQVELMYIGKEGNRRWANVTLFPTVTRPADEADKNAYIELKFNDDLKPLLLALKDKYRIYDIRNIIPLRSVYSIRLFELLKQYENTNHKSREFELSYLKEILGLIETDDEYKNRIKKLRGQAKENAINEGKYEKYPLYADFKRRVLNKAKTDLKKHCDITFTFDEIKEGRKVVALKFYIKSNKPKRLKEPNKYDNSVTVPIVNNKTSDDIVFNELYPKVKKWLSENALKKILKEQNEEKVRKAIKVTLQRIKKGDKIKNIAGYIISLSKQNTLFDAVEDVEQKETAKKEKAANQAKKKKQLEERLKQLFTEWTNKQKIIVEELLKDNPDIRQVVFEKTKLNKFSHYQADKTDEENFQDAIFAAAFRNNIKKEFPEKFTKLEKQYEPKIKALKDKIVRL